jgi:hypothetical protein
VVANCHKQKASEFEKMLLSIDDQFVLFKKMIKLIKSINPEIKIIITVSPVRHIKDGLSENSVSKAILRILANTICQNDRNCNYFPSFEIMVDELRDYRFYTSDLIHPSPKAIDLISARFAQTYFSEKTLKICTEWKKAKESINHRPLNVNSKAHQLFLNCLYADVQSFSEHFNVSKELESIKQQIYRTLPPN